MGSGAAALAFGSFPLAIAGAFGWGTGLGLTIPTTNLLVSELNPGRRAAALNLVNFSWGIGAVAGPFLIAGLQHANRTAWFMYGILGLSVLLAVLVSTCDMEAQSRAERGASDPRAWRSLFVPVLAA